MFRLFLAVCIFITQGLFAHAAELSLWSDRRRLVQARATTGNVAAPDSLRVLQDLPAASARSPLLERANPWTETAGPLAPLLSALPAGAATVRRVALPKGREPSSLVLLIQDVHQNLEAQKNISRILGALSAAKSNPDVVALEGSSGPLKLAPFRAFPDQDVISHVADKFLEWGRISGAGHAAATHPALRFVTGIDDPALHHANVRAYLDTRARAAGDAETLSRLQSKIETEKSRVFNPDLAAFDRVVSAYRQ